MLKLMLKVVMQIRHSLASCCGGDIVVAILSCGLPSVVRWRYPREDDHRQGHSVTTGRITSWCNNDQGGLLILGVSYCRASQ